MEGIYFGFNFCKPACRKTRHAACYECLEIGKFPVKEIQDEEGNNGKKSKAKKKPVSKEEIVMTTADYKAQHSIMLTKIHEEVQLILKEIRMKLNALDLHCQPKKMKNSIKKSSDEAVDHFTLPGSEIRGIVKIIQILG